MDNNKFIYIEDIIPNIILDIRYNTKMNFVGEVIDGYIDNTAILTKEAGEALKHANNIFNKMGYRIKIYDAYRPQIAVNHFIRWSNKKDTKMKELFYPKYTKEELIEKEFIAKKSAHTRGSTIDMTLVDINNKQELDMGGYFDLFDEISYVNSNNITYEQKRNRKLLRDVMIESGFNIYDKEWWHFTLKNEPYPDTYFNFLIEKGKR